MLEITHLLQEARETVLQATKKVSPRTPWLMPRAALKMQWRANNADLTKLPGYVVHARACLEIPPDGAVIIVTVMATVVDTEDTARPARV